MNNESLNEKRYVRTGFAQKTCPRCHGSGLDSMAIFTQVMCGKCRGDGVVMVENVREEEMATHKKADSGNNNERRNAWLFSEG